VVIKHLINQNEFMIIHETSPRCKKNKVGSLVYKPANIETMKMINIIM
jgi:hypothetical protein